MIIETPQGTWTPKVALDHDAGTDQTHTQSPAQSPCPHEKVAKMVAHSSEPPSDTENYEAPGARLFDNPVLYDNIFGWDASEELDFITSTTNADRLIEFGCGSGRVLLPLLERGYQVDGIDSSSDALTYLSEAAAERKTKHTPRLILGDLTEVALLPTYPGLSPRSTLCDASPPRTGRRPPASRRDERHHRRQIPDPPRLLRRGPDRTPTAR
ncbi:class I SAM-dependent methyltransferase [Pseudoglutamicibacter albus]|uniref:class I SAM-dependent methyltransferase n=1 Tax=Pseudoglutamicibacter albus TaxID=98671 RepID=UPI00360ED3B0